MDGAMGGLSDTAWILLGFIGAGTVLGFLYSLARAAQREVHVVQTEQRVRRLRQEYARRARSRAGLGDATEEIIEVDEAPPEPAGSIVPGSEQSKAAA